MRHIYAYIPRFSMSTRYYAPLWLWVSDWSKQEIVGMAYLLWLLRILLESKFKHKPTLEPGQRCPDSISKIVISCVGIHKFVFSWCIGFSWWKLYFHLRLVDLCDYPLWLYSLLWVKKSWVSRHRSIEFEEKWGLLKF